MHISEYLVEYVLILRMFIVRLEDGGKSFLRDIRLGMTVSEVVFIVIYESEDL